MKPSLIAAGTCGMVLIISACFAQNQQTAVIPAPPGSHDYSELTQAPEKAKVRVNPLGNDPDAVVAGGILFEDHCAECHGDAGVGGKKAPSLRTAECNGWYYIC